MKLKTKILLSSSLFMLGIILVVNLSIYYFFYKVSTNTELNELKLVINDITQALNENPNVDSSELLEAYLPANGMIRIILDSEVRMLEQTRSKDYTTLPWEFKQLESHELISKEEAPDIAVVEKPIIWRTGEHAGEIVTIQVSNHLVSLHETLRILFYVLTILSFIVLIPIFIGSSILSRFLLRPIQNLIKTMKDNMNYGKWQKIDIEYRSHDELHEMELTFNQMIDYLKTSYEKQEMFVSDASHELKTPIQIIKSYAQLVERRGNANPELVKESVLAIDSEADRMKKLVEQMLLLAKNKQLQPRLSVNIVNVMDDIINVIDSITEREISIEKSNDFILVKADQDQLKQLLYILMDNALKYSEKTIHVRIFKKATQAVVEVQDYGKGISQRDQERIFDRFYRVDKARNRDTGGTGLGLSIAKSIAEAHDGKLSVKSELNKGSTFIVSIPVLIED
ncbi:sensor histidine kinase [Metabacillus endolithicus]|uniref:Signal transduction histidine-protein kinase ArlS n=1 Tax=Metabacillus endolithicus TaxID=1535204 RepID=A0ABW5BTN1_9BACI|nr:HAMP domain-containing sensor histidine kinase [Metabacillus endolithicus]UPG63774.1 HAMP domain-containing histidine kinase [Metabacillus endolithicus]